MTQTRELPRGAEETPSDGAVKQPGPNGPPGSRGPRGTGSSGTGPSRSPASALIRLLVVLGAVTAVAIAVGAGALELVIVAIIVMVMVHELGHFATAKWSGMKVTEYFVGFGPRLWSIRRGETEYGVKAIPAGGYVKIPGMTNLEEIDEVDEPRTYRQQPFRKRILVASAGSIMHFVMAFILAWCALVFIGTAAPGTKIATLIKIQGVAKSPAQRAGLRVGDQIVAVNGKPVNPNNPGLAIQRSADKPVQLSVIRDNHLINLTVTPIPARTLKNGGEAVSKVATSKNGHIGISFATYGVPENPFGALGGAAVVVGQTTQRTISGLGQVFSPHGLSNYYDEVTNSQLAAKDAKNGTPRINSIVGAGEVAVQGVHLGVGAFLEVLIAINIAIGLINMLPMLPLDGGHVVIALYERIRTRRGRPYYRADAAKLLPVAYVFMAALLIIVISAAYLDITHPVTLR